MSYAAFPIADFRTGAFSAKEAWLSPPDAFRELKNANVFRGRMKKREGMDIQGYFPTRNAQSITGITGADPAVVTMGGAHGLSDGDVVIIQSVAGMTEVNNNKYVVANKAATTFELQNEDSSGFTGYSSGGTVDQLKSLTWKASIAATGITAENVPTVTTSAAHGLSSGNKVMLSGEFQSPILGMTSLDSGVVSTITVNTTTTFTLDQVTTEGFTAHTSGGDVFLVNEASSNGVMGLGEVYQDEADNKLIAINQKRIAQWDSTLSNFTAVSTADIFTSGTTDLFQVTNAFGKAWITNFKDNVYTWDGSTETKEVFDIDGDGAASPTFGSHNDLDRCKFIFQFNRRLILLYTVESATKYAQRVRWSRLDFGAGTTSEWDDTADDTTAGSLDADTDEEIVTAGFLKDNLIVFFERSIWALTKTGSVDIPFRWEKLAEHPGVFASRFGSISHGNLLWAMGAGGMIATDGLQIKSIDEVIPDFEDEIDDNNWKRVFMSKAVSLRETWVAYSSVDNTQNDKVKVLDYDNGTWAEYDIGYNVMSEFTTENIVAKAWSAFVDRSSDTWEKTKVPWENFATKPGAPQNVIGDNSGMIFKINEGSSDVGRKIDVILDTARFNPFKEQGKAARFGWVDFLFDEEPSTSLEVEFFIDFEGAPHTTQTLSLSAETRDDGTKRDSVTKIWKRMYVDVIGNSHRMRITHNSNNAFQLHAIVPYFRQEGDLELI